MAKFKVGDKVTDGNSVFKITKVTPDDYGWKLVKGDGKDAFGKSISAGGMISWADQKMRKAANAVTSKNPVVQNALESTVRNVKAYDGYGRSIKVGDEVDTNKGLARVVQIKNRDDGSIHGVASYIGLSYKPNSNAVDEWIICRTDGSAHGVKVQNSVVANALNSVKAKNAKFKVGDKVKQKFGDYRNGVITKVIGDRYLVKWPNGDVEEQFLDEVVANAVAANAVDPLDALNSAETKMREAIGELGKVTDPDLRQLASRIATKLKAVQGELRRELAV